MRLIVVAFLLLAAPVIAQDKPAYKIFTKEGKAVAYDKMIKDVSKNDIVLFGELHDNAIDHWLELQVTKDIYTIQPDLALGFEMFEADDQIVLNEYLNGTIEERHLLNEAKVWDNYQPSGSGENMAKSQATKDATMAYFILKNKKTITLHFNGAYHSQNFEGINWYLKKADPKLKIVTIHSVEQDSLDKLDDANKNTADYIICIPKDMTKTY